MTVKISIAMATYNGAKYIQQQLNSIAAQIYLPFELIVCDDGSTDETVDIVRQFTLTASFPVHLVQNDHNLGFANNFLKCAYLCKGEWIAFCDQDDVWFPEKLSKVKLMIEDHLTEDLVMIYHSASLVSADLTPTGRRLPDFKRNFLKGRNAHYGFWCVGGCVTIFKSELLSGIDSSLRPRDNFSPDFVWGSQNYPWLPHDKWICMLANVLGETAYISETLGLYRRHGTALSGTHNEQSTVDRIKKMSIKGAAEYYQFQADVALECAESFRKISSFLRKKEKEQRLLCGACKFEKFADIRKYRGRLYKSSSIPSRLRIFFSILFRQGYWGPQFFSLGTLSLLKDLSFSIGLFMAFNKV